MTFLFFLSIFFGTTLAESPATETARSWTYKELRDLALQKSPRLQELELSYQVSKYDSRVAFASFMPELGVEGGARSDREKEKRNDSFYYGYGRWNLFRGGQDFSILRKEMKASDLANRKRIAERNQLSIKIANLFHDIYLIDRKMELKRGDFDVSEKQILMAKKKLQGGLTTRTDILDFELHQRLLKADLELLKVERSTLSSELAILVGLDPTLELSVNSTDHFETRSPLPDKAQLKKLSSENSIELQEAEFAKEAARYQSNRALGEYLPTVDVEARYGKLYETDFRSSRSNSWSVIGTVRVPIFTGFSTWNRFQSSHSEFERKQIQYEQAKRTLEAKVELLVQRFNALATSYDLAVQNQDTAKRYYDATLSEYQRGVKNSPDLAGATDRFFDARLKVYELEGDLHLTRLELAELIGQEEI